MQPDMPQFEKLLADIRDDAEMVAGFNARLRTQEELVSAATRELAFAEQDLQRPLTRPSPPPPGAVLREPPMFDSMQRRQQYVAAARQAYEQAVAELQALNTQADAAHKRLGLRRRRANACYEVAARLGVTLPCEPFGSSWAQIPAQPPARQFSAPIAVASTQQATAASTSPPAPSLASVARSVFDRMAGRA